MQRSWFSTDELADLAGVKPATIRTFLCQHGHYAGIRPKKLPNRYLAWPSEDVARAFGLSAAPATPSATD